MRSDSGDVKSVGRFQGSHGEYYAFGYGASEVRHGGVCSLIWIQVLFVRGKRTRAGLWVTYGCWLLVISRVGGVVGCVIHQKTEKFPENLKILRIVFS